MTQNGNGRATLERLAAKALHLAATIVGPLGRRVKAIHRRTLGGIVVTCPVCRRPVTWEEGWYRDPVTDVIWCERCRPAWSLHPTAPRGVRLN